jgi:uncharacterized protein with PIN domain
LKVTLVRRASATPPTRLRNFIRAYHTQGRVADKDEKIQLNMGTCCPYAMSVGALALLFKGNHFHKSDVRLPIR